MKRQVSVPWTAFYKYVLPGLFLLVLGGGVLAWLNSPVWWPTNLIPLFVLGSVGTIACCWLSSRLKWVQLGETAFYVRRFGHDIEIPFSIVSVIRERNMSPPHIVVDLNVRTDVGRSFAFLHRSPGFLSWHRSSLVLELQERVSNARNA